MLVVQCAKYKHNGDISDKNALVMKASLLGACVHVTVSCCAPL